MNLLTSGNNAREYISIISSMLTCILIYLYAECRHICISRNIVLIYTFDLNLSKLMRLL